VSITVKRPRRASPFKPGIGPRSLPKRKGKAVVGEAISPGDPGELPRWLRDASHLVNQVTETETDRLWRIRLIFALTKSRRGLTGHKGVGVFTFRPGAIPAYESSSIIDLSMSHFAEATRESQKMAENIATSDYFLVEKPGLGYPVINRERLIDFVLEVFAKPPIRTLGVIEMWYEHIDVVLSRPELLVSSGREKIAGHVNEILLLMEQKFQWDPWSNGIRRVDEKGIGPWVTKR
jgi:hypothetical protein